MRIVSAALITAMLPVGLAWAVNAIPPPTLLPLNQIAVPEPPNLFQFVKNRPAAIKLGKALFWDMQAGSDGIQACASCHFAAGADNRVKNTMNPGFDGAFHVRGPNETLQPTDFPFLERLDPDFSTSAILRDSNDVVGSQGVRFTDFKNIVVGSAVDNGVAILDSTFNVNGVNTRRVTGRQAPSVINAIFNFNNFWDGRAHFEFNGVNPFGTIDPSAGVWFNNNGTLVKQAVAIQFASLASQATGPPLNETEMSYRGRTFPQLGRKMLSLTPLGKQLVHPNDSELGPLSKSELQPDGSITGIKGLRTNYTQMIKDAFLDKFWNSLQPTPDGYSQMEANFSLFWGLAIQLYEATLVSDQTPYDQFLGGDQTALTDQQKDGFNLFFGAAGCSGCHFSTELTSASVRASGFLTNASHALIEPMPVVSGQQIIYDNGFNNTAVRRTSEDIGRGADSPFLNPLNGNLPFPLSFSALAELQALGKLGFNPSLFPLGSPLTPILPPSFPANFPVANNGNFKVPGLRNVELTAPYFHNGGVMTLLDVVEFYTRGGDFRAQNADSVDVLIADIGPLQHNPTKQASLVAFLLSFTDERVRNESAPFDHPELVIPNGDSTPGVDDLIVLPAKDANGFTVPPMSVTLTPSAASPQIIGSPISITAIGAGGIGPYEYRFYINDGSGAGFVLAQPYGASNTLIWNPSAAGNYDIFVEIRTSGTTSLRDAYAVLNYFQIKTSVPATGVTLTPSAASPQTPGTPIIFSAAAQGGSGPYEYGFYLNDGSGAGYVVAQPYGPSNTFVWTPSAAGNYDVFVQVRIAGSAVLRDAYAVINFFQIRNSTPATSLNLSPSVASPQTVGTPITITATGGGGSGPYEYSFFLNDGSGAGFVPVQPYSPVNTFIWTPSAAGNYDLFVQVRLAGSSVLRDAYNALYFYRIN
jgi:cytochrome c peroxidase